MVDIVTIADGDTNWGNTMRGNLQILATAINQNVTATGQKYTLPASGMPATDLASAVRSQLTLASSAYQKPAAGIPTTDLSAAAQSAISRANTAVLKVNGYGPDQDGNVTVTGGGGATVSSVNGLTGDVVLSKSDIGLASVDNTSDANKPVSTAQATAIGQKYTKPTGGITASDLAASVQTSLGKADSAVQPSALAAYVKTVNGVIPDANGNVDVSGGGSGTSGVSAVNGRTGNVTLSKSDVGLTNADNTADTAKPVSTAQAAAIASAIAPLSAGGRLAAVARDVSGQDANTVTDSGWARGSGITNAPTSDWYYLQVINHNAGNSDDPYVYQRAICYAGDAAQVGKTWERQRRSNAWQSWVLVADTTGAVDAAARATAGTAVQPARLIATGTGLIGGRNLAADMTIALSSATVASLAKADSALQSAPVTSVAGRTGAVVLAKADVGLGNVDNTADTAKPVSTAQATAINAKYTKPSTGIPASDLAAAAQTLLGKAGSSVQTVNGTAPDTNGNVTVSGGATDPYQTSAIDNGDLSTTVAADANGVRSWMENAADLGPTMYALSRMAPGITNTLGYEVVRPTGGVADQTVINAALQRSSIVVLTGDFRTSGTILIPSYRTLVLMDAYVQLQPQSNCNIISNSNLAVNGNTEIKVLGIGRAVVDGMSNQQTKQTGSTWKNIGVHWVGVSKYQVRGITIKNTSDFSAFNVGCTQGVWTDITLDQDRTIGNQDGIDIGPACSYIYITNIRGTVGDDCFSIFAKYTTGGGSVHPAFATNGGDTHHIYISDVFLSTQNSLVRIQAAEGSSLHHLYLDNIHHTGENLAQSFVNIGELKSAYITGDSPNLNGTDLYAIYASNMSGRVDAMVRAGTSARDLFFSNFSSDQWNYVVLGSEADRTCQITNMNIDGVFTQDKNGLNTTGVVLQVQNTYVTLVDCSITRMNIQTCDRVTNSTSATSGRLSGIFGKVNLRVLGGSVAFAGETDLTVKTTPPTTGATAPTKPGYTYIRNNS